VLGKDEKLSAEKFFQVCVFFTANNVPQSEKGEKILNPFSYICQSSQMIPQDRKFSKFCEKRFRNFSKSG